MTPRLRATGLTKTYGERRAVDGIDLVCRASSVLGLLGPNGAGKTTTLRLLYGFVEADAGHISYDDLDFRQHRTSIKRTIGVCTQDDTLDYDFTVEQNLRVYARYFRPRIEHVERRVDELLSFFELQSYRRDSPRALSGGTKRRLLIARSIIHQPTVLFLDEPTTGLDPKARFELWGLIDRLRSDGMAIVLTTHYMDEAERLSDELLVLASGKTIASGTPAEVMSRLVGEHVLVVSEQEPGLEAVVSWAEAHGLPTARVLGELRLALSSTHVAQLTQQFSALRLTLRPPTLDDLFLALQQ